jgi:PAS domain S-box-containing protein
MTSLPMILVVEDNPISRKLLRVILEAEGYQVLEAPDGATALALLARQAPDLILQDLHLPDMDGFELVRRLRALPHGQDVPILAVSGFMARLEEAQAIEVGFNGFLGKPIAPAQLLESLGLFLPRTPPPEPAGGQDQRVLVVTDGPIERRCLEHFLIAQGFRVALASTGREALAAARAEPPAVLLADLLLLDMDGFDLCHALREDPRLQPIPVVLTTALPLGEEARALASEAGARALVSRKSGLQALAKALLAALEPGPVPAGGRPLAEARSLFRRSMAGQYERLEASHAALVQQCAIQSAQLSVLGTLCEALGRADEPQGVLAEVLGAAMDAAGVSKGALFLVDPKGDLVLNQAIGYLPEDRPMLEAFFGWAELLRACLRSGTILTPTEQTPGPHLSLPEGLSALLVPVAHGGQGLGVLFLVVQRANLRGGSPLAFARALAAELAQALTLASAFGRLALSEERYRGIVESTTEGVWTIDADRRTTFVNQRVCDLLGYPMEAILGRSIFDFYDPDQHPLVRALSGRTLRGSPGSQELKLRHRDGTEFWVHLSTAPLRDAAGHPIGAMALVGDRSEQKRLQEQLMVSDRMASVGLLAAGVAHEINNPLTVVLANLELARQELSRSGQQLGEAALRHVGEQCRDAHEAAVRVVQIVRDLKLFSRSEEDLRGPVAVRSVLESTLRMAGNEIHHRARLVQDYRPIPSVSGNASRLGQVFLNLLVNAAQAIPEGQAERNEIRVATRLAEPGLVAIEITDTGAGMSPEVLKRLFTPFFTTKPVGLGTGLGLSICHRIIGAMGGEIRVQSQVGQGTTFQILLPEAPAAAPEPAAATPEPAAAGAGRRARILVVDDEPMVVAVLQGLLAPEHEVVAQACARDALAQIRGGTRFDLILCDLMMPSMTGMDLHEALRQAAPDQAERMVFMSGGAFTPRARDFLAEVTNVCVDKPFDLQGLRELIRVRTGTPRPPGQGGHP